MTFPAPEVGRITGELGYKSGSSPDDNRLGNQGEPVFQEVQQFNKLFSLLIAELFNPIDKDG